VDPAARHRDDPVRVARRLVEVVQHQDDGAAVALVELLEQVEHLHLVGEVQIGGGLVQRRHHRFARSRPGPSASRVGAQDRASNSIEDRRRTSRDTGVRLA
jgi:hypothetical protein